MRLYLSTQESEMSLEEIKKWSIWQEESAEIEIIQKLVEKVESFENDLKTIQGKTSFVMGNESAERIKEIREYVTQKLSTGVEE